MLKPGRQKWVDIPAEPKNNIAATRDAGASVGWASVVGQLTLISFRHVGHFISFSKILMYVFLHSSQYNQSVFWHFSERHPDQINASPWIWSLQIMHSPLPFATPPLEAPDPDIFRRDGPSSEDQHARLQPHRCSRGKFVLSLMTCTTCPGR